MTRTECPHEQDVIDAIQSARWPARAEAALVAHVDQCDVCRDVATVAAMILTDAHDAVAMDAAETRLPDAGAVWLRAQWRARAEDERRVTHPITAAQAAAIAAAAAVGGVLLGATSASLQGWLTGAAVGLGAIRPHIELPSGMVALPSAMVAALAGHLTAVVGIGMVLVLAPLATYWVTRE